jgi:hypothetical protein
VTELYRDNSDMFVCVTVKEFECLLVAVEEETRWGRGVCPPG